MKEILKKSVNKACIYTATLLVAVLVFIAYALDIPLSASEGLSKNKNYPISSVEKIAKKLKNFEKYYKPKSKNIKPDNDTKTDNNTDSGEDNTQKGVDYTEDDLRLMSGIIYCEAGSMSEAARIAVANVILNRARDTKNWGHVSTVYEVIYDQKWGVQFSPIKGNPSTLDQAMEIYDKLEEYEGSWRYDQMKNCISSAKKAFSGEKAIPDSYMYFNGSIESSKKKCEENGRSYIIIDHHIYFE